MQQHRLQVFRRPDLSGYPWVICHSIDTPKGRKSIQIPFDPVGAETAFDFVSRIDMKQVEEAVTKACAREGVVIARYEPAFLHTPDTDWYDFDRSVWWQIVAHFKRLCYLLSYGWLKERYI